MEKNFFNLMFDDLTELSIKKDDYFNCVIENEKSGAVYDGFILAKSPTGKATTICEVGFQKSDIDKRYQPRLTFKRTDEDFNEKKIAGKSITQRISFHTGGEGYREFWKMISFLSGFKELVDIGNFKQDYKVVTDEEFSKYLKIKEKEGSLEIFEKLVEDSEVDSVVMLRSASTIKLLKSYRDKIKSFISNGASETDVQNWIDQDDHKFRQERCMIFGLEFIDHKREGGASGNRYDLLTRIGSETEERVLIELKSPSDDIFNIKNTETINDIKKEYSISNSLARAIPQILEYKKTLEDKNAGDPELEKIGELSDIKINKCIIVIGSKKSDPRWLNNLREFRNSLNSNLEIWTYTDLFNKIDSTIKNLEQEHKL